MGQCRLYLGWEISTSGRLIDWMICAKQASGNGYNEMAIRFVASQIIYIKGKFFHQSDIFSAGLGWRFLGVFKGSKIPRTNNI